MKRKISIILILTMVVSTLLAGCSNPLDKFKKGEDEVPTEIIEENTNVTLIGTGSYMVGDIVTIDDVISIDADVAGNVTNKVFLSDTGSLLEQLDTSEAGEFTVNIVVEFIDAEGWQKQYTYVVEKPESKLPDSVKANFDNAEKIYTFEGLSIVCPADWSYGSGSSTFNGVESEYVQLTNFTTESNIGGVVIRKVADKEGLTDLTKSAIQLTLGIIFDACTDEDSLKELEEDSTAEGKYEEAFNEFVDSIVSTTELETNGMTIYDIDGNQYTGKVLNTIVDLSCLYPGADRIVAGYSQYIEINGSIYEIDYLLKTEDAEDGTESEDTEEMTEYPQVKVDESILTADGIKAHFTKISEELLKLSGEDSSMVAEIVDSITETNPDNYDIATGYIIYGTYEKEDVTEETANSVEVEAGNEEETVSGMVGNVKPTYQSKHPELYTWPESDTKYRKWIYVIGEGVTYTGSIILPDGTVLSTENGDSINSSNGSMTNGESTQGNNSVVVSLMSSYGTYFVSNKDKQEAIIDTANSSSSVAVVSYNNNKYYIETARAATITNYQQNCIYSTAGMKDGSYVVESVDSKAITTEIGKIIPYTISYTDYNYKKQEKGYMAVYNINNDYLVIYADNTDADSSTMTELLSKLISK